MTTQNHELWSISPLDGRYRRKLDNLSTYVSEGALISYRIKVEARWLRFLVERKAIVANLKLDAKQTALLAGLSDAPPVDAANQVKQIERETNHDVKAVEYYLRDSLKAQGASEHLLAMIHFACTSEDINNTSYGLMLADLRVHVFLPAMDALLKKLREQAKQYASLSMLARTHGQTASPTTLGKELAVFVHRLSRCIAQFRKTPILAKMNGAVGNFNAHVVSFPDLDWMALSKEFIESDLKLAYNPLTTQIENHDSLVEYTDCIRRFNTILLDLCRDLWSYISLGYFTQQKKDSEVGSSTMPHKINPIDFENAEGNLGLANALAEHFAQKLPISRWQRDLSDSTVLRSLGSFAGYSMLAYQACLQGLDKITANETKISSDLDDSWEVLAEAVQTVMRKFGVADAYERAKAATRGRAVDQKSLHEMIDDCAPVPAKDKQDLKRLRPRDYVGLASKLALLTDDEEKGTGE